MQKWEPSPLFDALVREHLPALRALVRRVLAKSAAGDVDDVCQETLIKCRRSFNPELAGSFRFWFLRSGRNNAISVLRRTERMLPVDEVYDDAQCVHRRHEPDALEVLEIRETRYRLELAIEAAVPNRTHRRIFRLRHFEGLPYKDIAEHCGVPIGTVMSALNRAKALLYVHLKTRRDPIAVPFLAA